MTDFPLIDGVQNRLETVDNRLLELVLVDFSRWVGKSERTAGGYEKAAKRFILWLQNRRITKPTKWNILDYRAEMVNSMKPTSVNANIVGLRRFFKYLADRDLYPNIAENIEGTTVRNEFRKDALETDEIKSVLAGIDRTTAEGKRDFALLVLLVSCGLRTIEANRCRWEDLDRSGGKTILRVQGKGRNEKDDFVIVPPAVESALMEYRAETKAGKEEPIFQSRSNNSQRKALSTRTIRGMVKDYFRAAGLDSERLTAHSLRHTAVTIALKNGQTIQEAKTFARHSNIQTTLIYAHNLDRLKNDCSATVAGVIFD